MSLRDHLQAIYDQHGKLTPSLVVDAARNPGHPLHSRFEWDDAAAGEAWRNHQASELIRSVKVVYREATEKDAGRMGRAYLNVRRENGNVYEPVEQIVQDPFTRKLVLADMEREWKALFRRYKDFAEFADVVRRDLGETA